MKKILHISTYYLPNYGGIEQVAYDIVSGLKSDYDRKVMCFNHENINIVNEYDGVEIHRIRYIKKIASQAISFNYFFKLKKILKDYNPDIIYIHLPNPLITIFLLFINLDAKKIILHWHSDIIDQKRIKKLYLPFQRKILERANLVFVTSEEYKRGSKDLKFFLDKVKVLPNIVNIKKLELEEENYINMIDIKKKYEDKRILFFLGRHVPYKGLEYLIEVSKLIDKQAVIIIGGSGPLTENLKSKSINLKNIVFLGRLTDNQVKEYLNVAYLFLFPSITKNEAFGVALAEALYCGIPSISFKIEGSGVNWVNQNEITGYVVKNMDVEAYAKKINELIYNEKLREEMSVNAKKWVEQNFMKENMIKNLKKYL